jgi:hypothetical protein
MGEKFWYPAELNSDDAAVRFLHVGAYAAPVASGHGRGCQQQLCL